MHLILVPLLISFLIFCIIKINREFGYYSYLLIDKAKLQRLKNHLGVENGTRALYIAIKYILDQKEERL